MVRVEIASRSSAAASVPRASDGRSTDAYGIETRTTLFSATLLMCHAMPTPNVVRCKASP